MAFPIIPLVLVGAGVYVLRQRRAKRKKKVEEPGIGPIQTVVFVGPPKGPAPEGPTGAPGQPCDGGDGYGAWDDLGYCKTFWIEGETDEAIARLAMEEWEARGSPEFSDLYLMVPDIAGGELAPPKDNPALVDIVATCLQRYYGVGSVFPPKEAENWEDTSSPYWVHRAWSSGYAVVRRTLCGA